MNWKGKVISVKVERQDYEEYRVVKRKGKVRKIQLVERALPFEKLYITSKEHKIVEVQRSGRPGREVHELNLELGKPVSNELFFTWL